MKYELKYFLLLLVFILLSLTNSLLAQGDEKIYMTASHLGGDMTVKWYPFAPEDWDKWNKIGYILERTELDQNGEVLPLTRTIIAENIMPKDSSWFNQNADAYFGTMGMLLYDTTFQFESDSLLNSTKLRYDYLVHEAQLDWDAPALAVGLGFADSTMVDGLFYRYRIFVQQNGEILADTYVDMTSESGKFANIESVPADAFDFYFPGGQSLLDMSGKLTQLKFDVIYGQAKPMGDSIVLRWSPNHAAFWQAAMDSGYQILRVEYLNDTLAFETEKLFQVKPWKETDLTTDMIGDSMALVAAQVMFGRVEVPALDLYEQSSLFENKFGMALFAAERSALAADILGFRLVDKDVAPEKKYSYFIGTQGSSSPTHMAILEVENIPKPAPTPEGFDIEEGDGVLTLKWPKASNDLNFSAYLLEKSKDNGETWTKISNKPFLILEDESMELDEYKFVDSVENYQEYVYKLSGYTTFADLGEPIVVVGTAKDLTPPPNPVIRVGDLTEDEKQINLKWEIQGGAPTDLKGYFLLLNPEFEGYGDTISELLSVETNTFTYNIPDSITFHPHYFKVAAVDTAGNQSISFPHFVMVPDKIPPLAPENIYGHIDSAGVVTIVWDHSVSEDATNYHVLFSNNPEHEFSLLNPATPLEENIFYDTIALTALDEYIYYMILAEDVSYNRSEPSAILRLKRPDNVPPIKPLLKKPMIETDGLKLTWQPSTSEDCVGYEIYRRLFNNEEEWTLVSEIDTTTKEWVDEDTKFEQMYQYTMRAVDDANLYSDYCFPQRHKRSFTGDLLLVENLQAIYNAETKQIDLTWEYTEPADTPESVGNFSFYILKSYGAEQVEMYLELEGNDLFTQDVEVAKDAIHNYAVMVIYDNGLSGKMSEVVSVVVAEEGE